VAEGGGLLNRCTASSRTVSSNLIPSAKSSSKSLKLFGKIFSCLLGPIRGPIGLAALTRRGFCFDVKIIPRSVCAKPRSSLLSKYRSGRQGRKPPR
jgi:hypothetical protein